MPAQTNASLPSRMMIAVIATHLNTVIMPVGLNRS